MPVPAEAGPAALSVVDGVLPGSVRRGGQSVTLSASGLPTGATAAFTPASLTSGASSTLKITTGSSTPAGTYTRR